MAKHDLINREVSEGRDYVRRFCLWEKQLNSFNPSVQLNWSCVAAKSSERSKLPNSQGVYAFVVRPHPELFDWAGYILYVGMTENQSFPVRFQQYFNEPNKKKPRFWVSEMLSLWETNLYYYYAPLSAVDSVKAEDELLSALIPPNNERFPGELGKIKKEIYGR